MDLLLDQDAEVVVTPFEDTDDGESHATHMINPPDNLHIWQPGMEIREVVQIARDSNLEVKALCGYVWVPKRNPEKYDTCEPCLKVAGELMRSMGE